MNDQPTETPTPRRMQVDVDDGHYTVIMEHDGRLHALRYGEEWRDCTGDQLVLMLATEVEQWKASAEQWRDCNESNKRASEKAITTLTAQLEESKVFLANSHAKTNKLQTQLEEAEEALREIYMKCGGNDPSDGEGTSPQEVVDLFELHDATLTAQLSKDGYEQHAGALRLASDENTQLRKRINELEAMLETYGHR